MFDIKPDKNHIEYAREQVKKYTYGNRGYGDGNKNEQFCSVLGQTVIADLLNMDRPTGDSGFDNGVDFIINGKTVDVKTMTRTVPMKPFYVHNFIGYQKNYKVDYYIFMSYNKSINCLTIGGFIKKNELNEKADFFEAGTLRYRSDGTSFRSKAPLYEIVQSKLNPLNKLEDILQNIK
ncbi:MAG: hypothetical protein PHE29_07470 [Tissierellia bacterium]|nr:hypothetical protein [Tissierellia bacterium]